MVVKSQVHVEFFADAVEDKSVSTKKGRPVFKDVEKVRILFPGDTKRVLVAYATELCMKGEDGEWMDYRSAYPDHYAMFKKTHGKSSVAGTPLSEATFLTMAQRKMLSAQNVMTVEQLASLDGPQLRTLGMNARKLKDQATAYLESANTSADSTRLAAENAEMKEQLAALQAQMAEMAKGQAA